MTLITSTTALGGCPVCGANHATCGGPSGSIPIDERIEEAMTGGPLEVYEVDVNGYKAHLKLNEAEAAKYPDAKPVAKKAAKPRNKSRVAQNKS